MTEIVAPVSGNVWKVKVAAGDSVNSGDTLIILETMKLEIPIEADEPGVIAEIRVSESQAVTEDDVLIVLE